MPSFKVPCAAVLAVAALLAPVAASAQEADEIEGEAPPTRYPPTSVRWKLVAGGVVTTGLAYGVGYLCASTWPDAPGASNLKIPVVGPWMALADTGCAADDPDCSFASFLRAFLTIVGGVMQVGGLGIAGEGIFMTTEAAPPKRKPPAETGVVIRPMPVVTSRSSGLGLVGTF